MADLVKYPLQDGFKTSLSQIWTGGLGTVYLANTPSFTFPSGVTTYIVVNPGKSNMQIAEINAYDGTAKTVTVSNITLEKGASINSTAQTHNVGSEVIISDNYQFWKDIATAIGTKVNKDVTSTIANSIKLNFGSSSAYIWSDDSGANLKFKDGSNPEIDLSSLASGSGADTKVAVSPADTTTGTLSTKLTAGDGLTATIINPAGAEVYDIDVNTSDTATFVKTSSGAGDENKVPVLNASGQIAKGFIDFNTGGLNNYTLGETITAGDQVTLKTDGFIHKWAGYGATGSTISTVNLSMVRTFYVDTNTIVTAYLEASTSDVIVVAGSVSDAGVVTYGTPVTLDSSVSTAMLEGIKVDTNSGVIMYIDTSTVLQAHPFTVSGTTITAGTRGQVNGSATTLLDSIDICLIDTNKVYMTYANGAATYPNARVGVISSNTISFGTEVLNYNSSVAATEVKCCKIDTDKVLTTFIGAAADIITSVATISGTTITVAYANRSTYTGTAANHSIYQVATDKAIVVFDETDIKAFYITVSSTTPTNQTARTLISTSTLRGGGKPLIQLNSNVYGITGVASKGSITWFNTDTTTYTLPVIKTIDYTTIVGTGNPAELGYSNALPLTQAGSIGKFFMSTVITTRVTYLLNFDTHYLFGIAQESGTVGQSKMIAVNGQISTTNSGLSVGEKYYASGTGTYTVNSTAFGTTAGQVAFMGKALSTTSMLVDINLEDL